MSAYNAIVIACDDMHVSITGKLALSGVYTGDIVIPAKESLISQMVLLFLVDGEIGSIPDSVKIEVMLPGESPREFSMNLPRPPELNDQVRTSWTLKLPIPLFQTMLRLGQIKARIFYGSEIIEVDGPWIVRATAPFPTS